MWNLKFHILECDIEEGKKQNVDTDFPENVLLLQEKKIKVNHKNTSYEVW